MAFLSNVFILALQKVCWLYYHIQEEIQQNITFRAAMYKCIRFSEEYTFDLTFEYMSFGLYFFIQKQITLYFIWKVCS